MCIYAVGNQLLQTAMASHKPMQQRSIQFYFRDQATDTGTSESRIALPKVYSKESPPAEAILNFFFVGICQFRIRSSY